MTNDTISRLLDEIDTAYIEEYLTTQESLHKGAPAAGLRWVRLIPIAATVAALCFGAVCLLPALHKDSSPDLPPVGIGTSASESEEMAEKVTGTGIAAESEPEPWESAPETVPEPEEPTPESESIHEPDVEGPVPEETAPEQLAPETPLPPQETTPETLGEILYDAFTLFSVNDLKTYFSSGFTDLSLYETPPNITSLAYGNEYPSSFNGYFVDLYELFPALNPEKIVLEKIRLELYPSRHQYRYDYRTIDEKGGFSVRVEYRKNIGSRADMTEEELAAAYSGFIGNGNEVIFEDFTKTEYKPQTWGGKLYVGVGEGYVTEYEVWNGSVTAISICAGDLKISILSNHSGYRTHDDLTAVACLRKDSPERDEALRRIAAYCQALQKEHA